MSVFSKVIGERNKKIEAEQILVAEAKKKTDAFNSALKSKIIELTPLFDEFKRDAEAHHFPIKVGAGRFTSDFRIVLIAVDNPAPFLIGGAKVPDPREVSLKISGVEQHVLLSIDDLEETTRKYSIDEFTAEVVNETLERFLRHAFQKAETK